MVTVTPIKKALIPADSAAAQATSSKNYDEFQSDDEIRDLLSDKPNSILAVKMAHCTGPQDSGVAEGSVDALQLAENNWKKLRNTPLLRNAQDVLWVYRISEPAPGKRFQLGLGGMAKTAEIRTEETPHGTIIRNEGIKLSKAQGRADLIKKIKAYIGTVNLAIEDKSGRVLAALKTYSEKRSSDYETRDEDGWLHQVWLIDQESERSAMSALVAEEPLAFVADGNHRSKAAAMLGYESFLAVLFPAATMNIAPYNRLVKGRIPERELLQALEASFEVEELNVENYAPQKTHEIGFYLGRGRWLKLMPKTGTYDPANAAESIDADIVQRKLFAAIMGIQKATDERLTFVGANKPVQWLKEQVDRGSQDYAVTLPPVTMEQFVAVCKQDRMMPPKSTWFVPKIRSGLVMALLEE